MEPASSNCSIQPSIVILIITLIATSAATAMLCVAIMTQHWEHITWDKEKLEALNKEIATTSGNKSKYELEWLLNGQITRIVLEGRESKTSKDTQVKGEEDVPALFLVPMHGGIWTFCISISAEQLRSLEKFGFPQKLCTNYLTMDMKGGNSRTDWQHRMQNLSISCALVCLIILGSSALLGAFGVTKRQISAILITGVMYLLAAIFATFSLTIIHFRRSQNKFPCLNGTVAYKPAIEGVVISTKAQERHFSLKKVNRYFEGRIFVTSWSLHLAWGGTALCILVSILWIILSKIMRYSPFNGKLSVL